jgi:hypothetical protein
MPAVKRLRSLGLSSGKDPSTTFGQHPRMAEEEIRLALRQADQLRTTSRPGLEFIMEQMARLPTRKELWRAALMGTLTGACLVQTLALTFR